RGGEAANFAVQHDAAAPQTGLLSPPPHQKLKFLEVPRSYNFVRCSIVSRDVKNQQNLMHGSKVG
ncbi:MAG: hypothetical protein ACT4O2_06810, partial [Beijerinckiaceae bacterium]